MAVEERFGVGPGVIVGVQAKIVSGITDLFLLGVRVQKTNLTEERHIEANLQIDGELYEIVMVFRDDTLNNRNVVGRRKKKAEEN